MQSVRRRFHVHSGLILSLLVACVGCYNPKTTIESFRPQAQERLDAMQAAGKLVAALPPLTRDTLAFPDSAKIDFYGPKDGEGNVSTIHLEELSDFGNPRFENWFGRQEFHLVAYNLLHTGRDTSIYVLDKPNITKAFQSLLGKKYLVVLRTTKHVPPGVSGDAVYTPGEIQGEAYLCELSNPVTCYGGYRYEGHSSAKVMAHDVHVNNATRAVNDQMYALNADLGTQTDADMRHKLKANLPRSNAPAQW